jgi:hypothetical protein
MAKDTVDSAGKNIYQATVYDKGHKVSVYTDGRTATKDVLVKATGLIEGADELTLFPGGSVTLEFGQGQATIFARASADTEDVFVTRVA